MPLKIVSQPNFEPVTLDEAKDHLRITNDTEDEYLWHRIKAATQWVENKLNWRLCTQTWDYYLNDWPKCSKPSKYHPYDSNTDIIEIPYPPLQSVTTFTYYDTDDTQQTLVEGTDFRLDTVDYPGRIEPINGWPGVYDKVLPIQITFVCGFTKTDDIPQQIKDAILMRVADLHSNRQSTVIAMGSVNKVDNTTTAENLLMDFKIYGA